MSSISGINQQHLNALSVTADRLNTEVSGLSAEAMLSRILSRTLGPNNPSVVSSFGADSAVLLHMMSKIDPTLPVIFLDTGFHFSETLRYRETLQRHLGLTSIRVAAVDPLTAKRIDAGRQLHITSADACCELRKVSVLDRYLRMNDAWITGQRRSQSVTRTNIHRIEVDRARAKLKINPLADWTDHDIEAYKVANALPAHPLAKQGYPSIGCWPCTTPVRAGEHARAGRWRAEQKLECGLHNRSDIIATSSQL